MKTNMNLVLQYIDQHLEETLTIKELAEVVGYSQYHFSRLFKSYMNETVMEYVCKRRLVKASEEILLGKKIIDVALKYGWESHSGFAKAFIKEFGFYPSLLRIMRLSVECVGGNVMGHVFLESTKVGTTKEKLLQILEKKLKFNEIPIDYSRLKYVYKIACDAYENVKRYSGEDYITHLLNIAILLADTGASENVILASLFCDIKKKGVLPIEELEKVLPVEIYNIVIHLQKENTDIMSESDEVITIKLAERLHNMRTIEFIDESKKYQKAKETIELFMPLARKTGNKKLIAELQDLSLKYYI